MPDDVRAIAFDLDNTLWDVEPVLARAETRLLEWLHEHCPRIPEQVSLEDMASARAQLALDEPHHAHDVTYLRVTALARHARECGYHEDLAARAFEVFLAARCEVAVLPDVRPGLERLRRRFTLASLSNGNADLERIGLQAAFTVSLNAQQIGAGKPDRRCFERLASELGMAPAHILYVGDEPVLDVTAACAAGCRAAWMNRRGAPWPEGLAPPELTVSDCRDLASRLGA
ncbi:MAG TPA: HAD-IA family hydrolase [Steroidobacteraceae bacterium]|nr:HAD-IA family hydrolase [Steroidobacteraceae bacterium]